MSWSGLALNAPTMTTWPSSVPKVPDSGNEPQFRRSARFTHAGAEVVHQHVGLAGQPVDRLAAERVAHVDGHAALVAVQAPEHDALPAGVLHVHPREVAGAGPLDLDDVGAEIAQHLRRARSHLDLREVEDHDARERLRGAHRPDHRGARFSTNAFTPSA